MFDSTTSSQTFLLSHPTEKYNKYFHFSWMSKCHILPGRTNVKNSPLLVVVIFLNASYFGTLTITELASLIWCSSLDLFTKFWFVFKFPELSGNHTLVWCSLLQRHILNRKKPGGTLCLYRMILQEHSKKSPTILILTVPSSILISF